MFETFDHTADLGLRVRAASREQLFAEAGRGLFSVVVDNLDAVEAVEARQLKIAGAELNYLLFDWLSELLYLFETEQLLCSEFAVEMTADGIEAQVRGERIDEHRHHLAHEVKAITYHGLRVTETDNGWEAEVIVDI